MTATSETSAVTGRRGTAQRLTALDSPKFTEPKDTLMFYGGNDPITFPVPAFVIEHDRGLVLVDTMLDAAAAGNPEPVYGPISAVIAEYREEQTVEAQLAVLGYRPSDVTHVIASHLHFDHIGGLSLFGHAKCYIGLGEFPHAYWPGAATAGFFRRVELDAVREFDWHEVSAEGHDLFGDGSIVILWAPGHTPGQLAVQVRLPTQTIILATDVGHLRETFAAEMPTPFDVDTIAAVDSIRRLKLLADSLGARVWISHDADDWAEFPHAPDWIV
jgi:N-acyl homoserine lactone hydrolase